MWTALADRIAMPLLKTTPKPTAIPTSPQRKRPWLTRVLRRILFAPGF